MKSELGTLRGLDCQYITGFKIVIIMSKELKRNFF